ncbi:helix-turn-helix domain-containing protein [Halovivax sp.]|uniref:helix-turn-helix domain-containing protein n=1 Tax=Halovivax sp. TaxID=1935978 RepID=UPI0025B8F6DC|nr:helix-turn-helix domain-containing protein [Halovivax sp.]
MQAARFRLRVPEGSFPGVDRALARADGVEREQLVQFEWLTDGSYALLYRLRVDDPAAVESVLEDNPEVRASSLRRFGDRWYCYVHVAERDLLSELLAVADENALIIDRPVQFVSEGVALTVAGTGEGLQGAFRDASDAVRIDVEWSGEYQPGAGDAGCQLTPRQREALRTAHDLGFYENPRRSDYEELAHALDCAPSTANELLRRAETAIVDAVLDG